MNPYEFHLSVALAAVVDACKLSESVGRELTAADHTKKDDQSPVTIADFGVQAVIAGHLSMAFPDIPLVAEEDSAELKKPANKKILRLVHEQVDEIIDGIGGAEMLALIDRGNHAGGATGTFWTLDPIDGTKGFLRGDQYAIALALIENGRPVLGILGCPRLGDGSIYSALRGTGAMLCDLDGNIAAARIKVSTRAHPVQAVFCEAFESGHSAHDVSARVTATLGSTATPRRMDSQAKYAVVAAGQGDVYLRLPTKAGYEEKIWDHAAGALLVEAAGGRVTDIHGRPLDFSRGRTLAANLGIVATNAKLHDAVLAAIRTAQG